jgi:hypothetical protein
MRVKQRIYTDRVKNFGRFDCTSIHCYLHHRNHVCHDDSTAPTCRDSEFVQVFKVREFVILLGGIAAPIASLFKWERFIFGKRRCAALPAMQRIASQADVICVPVKMKSIQSINLH